MTFASAAAVDEDLFQAACQGGLFDGVHSRIVPEQQLLLVLVTNLGSIPLSYWIYTFGYFVSEGGDN